MSKTKKCVGKESFLRMNYLYQLGNTCIKTDQKQAANFYTSLIVGISKKAVQRIEPEIKRTICKTCHQLLVVGETCKVRVRRKKIVYTCLQCTQKKTYNSTPDYKIWAENPESVVEVLDYTQSQ